MFDVKTAKTPELVAEYNRLSGKAIKKFSSRAAGEKQVAALLVKNPQNDGFVKPKSALAKTAEIMDKVAKPKVEKAPADRSAAIRRSWSVLATHNARSARHNVEVYQEGHKAETLQCYRSTLAAFNALKLPVGQHIRFRMALKADGKKVFEHEGTKYHFILVIVTEKAAE